MSGAARARMMKDAVKMSNPMHDSLSPHGAASPALGSGVLASNPASPSGATSPKARKVLGPRVRSLTAWLWPACAQSCTFRVVGLRAHRSLLL